jgi:hypothetical protein
VKTGCNVAESCEEGRGSKKGCFTNDYDYDNEILSVNPLDECEYFMDL